MDSCECIEWFVLHVWDGIVFHITITVRLHFAQTLATDKSMDPVPRHAAKRFLFQHPVQGPSSVSTIEMVRLGYKLRDLIQCACSW